MAVFEFEANGRRFEVEAPDIDAALSAIGAVVPQSQPAPAAAPDRGALSAAAGSMIEGLPIVGPYIKSGVDKGVAGLRSLSSGDSYADELQNVEAGSKATGEAHPIASGVGSVAGGVLGTAPMVMAAPAAFGAGAGGLLGRSAASAVSGGVLGGADAAARSGGDLEAIKSGLKWGAGLGAAGPAVGAGVGKVAGNVVRKFKPPAIPSIADIKASATASKAAAKQAGVAISPTSLQSFATRLGKDLADEGIDPTLHPGATAAFKRISDAAGSGTPLGIADTEILRRVAGAARSNVMNPDEQRIGGIMQDALDDYVGSLKPADLLSGDANAASNALINFRSSWSRARKAENVSEAIIKAERQAARSGTGGNAENAIRQKISAILDNPKKVRGFSKEERAAMEKIVRGTRGQNALRSAGRLSPTTGGLSAALNLGATAMNPAMAAFGAGGLAAKTLADRGTRAAVNHLDELIRSGGNIPRSAAAQKAREEVEALVRLLTAPSPLFANQLQPAPR